MRSGKEDVTAKGRVLVLDDDKDMCKLISYILKEKGISADIVYNGETALAKIKKHPYDVMILDYKLPGMSGVEVLENALKERPSMKAIMISAYGDRFTKSNAKALGAYAFLDKPFDINRLVRTVKNVLAKKSG